MALPMHPKPALRRSDIERWLTCEAFERETGEVLAFGQAFAAFSARYKNHLRELRRGSDMTAAFAMAHDAWLSTAGNDQNRFPEFRELCERYAERYEFDFERCLGVEVTLTHDVGWAIITGTADGLYRADEGDIDDPITRLRFEDEKTERRAMDHWFQISFYTQLAFLRPGFEDVREIEFVINPVRVGEEREAIIFVRGELDHWWSEVLEAAQAVYERRESGRAIPTGGPACESCARRRTCGEAIHPAAVMPVSEAEADAMFADFLRVKAAADVRWEALKSFYEWRSPRVANGLEVGWLTSREERFWIIGEALEVKATLDARGWDGAKVLSVDAKKIDNPAIKQWLIANGMAEKSVSTTAAFKTRKALPAKEKPSARRG